MSTEEIYTQFRNKYLPKKIRVVFVAESPPAGHGYIYDPEGRPTELFFRSMMRTLFHKDFDTKREGLQAFADAGFLLVNPIYTPVNKLPDTKADELIMNNYPKFLRDLDTLGITAHTPIILIKKNICELLEPRLTNDGYTVLNKGIMIPFPMHYHFETFKEKVTRLVSQVFDE